MFLGALVSNISASHLSSNVVITDHLSEAVQMKLDLFYKIVDLMNSIHHLNVAHRKYSTKDTEQ